LATKGVDLGGVWQIVRAGKSKQMKESGEVSMRVLSREKSKVLAEKYGWSLARAQGFVDGEIARRRRTKPSAYVQIGIDDYCLGFRQSYYGRQKADSTVRTEQDPVVRRSSSGVERT
jgi:hypothetical protein